MLGPPKARRLDDPITVSLDALVPPDHFSRHLERSLGLSFVREMVRGTYADSGRPSIDPVVVFKLHLILFLEGRRSERQLMRVVADRLSLRWYLGYSLTEALPDHSSLTRIRERDVVDGGRARIILTVLVTPAEVQDNQPAIDLLWRTRFRWNLHPRQVIGDSKYGTTQHVVAIEGQRIRAAAGGRSPSRPVRQHRLHLRRRSRCLPLPGRPDPAVHLPVRPDAASGLRGTGRGVPRVPPQRALHHCATGSTHRAQLQ